MTEYVFDHWVINGTVFTDNPLPIIVSTDINVEAIYRESTVPPPPPPSGNTELVVAGALVAVALLALR